MAVAALTPEPGLSAHLCKQHVIDSINLVTCEIVILKKQDKVINMVTALQPVIRNAQEFTCKITCMPVTGGTTVIP